MTRNVGILEMFKRAHRTGGTMVEIFKSLSLFIIGASIMRIRSAVFYT